MAQLDFILSLENFQNKFRFFIFPTEDATPPDRLDGAVGCIPVARWEIDLICIISVCSTLKGIFPPRLTFKNNMIIDFGIVIF